MQILCSLTLVVMTFLCWMPSLMAEEACSFREWSELFDSVIHNASEVRALQDQKTFLDTKRSVAGIKPSPRFSGQVYKDFDHVGDGELEASYLLVWENEKKKQARELVVDETLRKLEAMRDLSRAQTKIELMIGLYRLQQIAVEQAALQESKDTYRRLSSKLKALPALAPEQELTLSIFQMAEDESQTKISLLEADRAPYLQDLSRLTGCSDPKINFILKLPLTLKKEGSPQASSLGLSLKSDLKLASAEQEQAVTSLERDVEVGPIFRMNRDRDESKVSAGIAFSIPLNGTNKATQVAESKAQYKARESEIELSMLRLDNERLRWQSQFSIAELSLSKRWDMTELTKRHKAMETLFASGRINASLIIEGHRQILESLRARHAMETLAFTSYWNVQLLSGSILEDQKL